MSLHLVRAAAGTGKTTDLARRYLGFLASGIPIEKAIAITFTRRAAAELQERVTLALRASLDGPAAEQARARLGDAWTLYADAVPSDPGRIREALAGLSEAPIGTTDGFIRLLLTEYAVDAVLPIPGQAGQPLDIPVRASAGFRRLLDGVARRVLDPPDGSLDPDVELLTRYFKLDEILADVNRRTPLDHLPVADCAEVMTWVGRHIAAVLQRFDLHQLYGVQGSSAADWEAALDKHTNTAGKWAVPIVAQWLADGGDPQQPPHAIAGWLRGLSNRRGFKAIRAALEAQAIDFGISSMALWKIIEALRYPYEEPAHVELADRLRAARERLRARVIREGLRTAALTGALGHAELAEAAITLCEQPPPRLHGRYAALLVDEFQDANPAQIRLYRALSRLPGPTPVQTYFVGDSRQSIYLFRDAEPGAFQELADQTPDATTVELLTNYRSSPSLVAAHRTLFAALSEPMQRAGWQPLADLSALAHHPPNVDLALDPAHHPDTRPVWLVHGQKFERLKAGAADKRALHAFLERVERAWSHPDHAHDTAAVLAPNWRAAREACEHLRRWTGRHDIAYVEGGTTWTRNRVGTDLALWLRALLDTGDDIAWLAVWKHPSVGLSDAAIARVRSGVGLLAIDPETGEPTDAPRWPRALGLLAEADHLGPPHRSSDIDAFRHAAPHIRRARAAIDRSETSEILDILATELHWRTLLAAGPGGDDDLAELEVALDWVRAMGADVLSDEEIVTMLSDEKQQDPPHVHLNRPQRYIACTTVFQAKGLAWDHVCVASPGRGSRRDPTDDASTTWVTLGNHHRVRLVGLKFDPTGGLSPFKDPLGRLASAILRERFNEECARLAYVAITRARRTVTAGTPTDFYYAGEVQKVIAQAWSPSRLDDPNVSHILRPNPPETTAAPTGWARHLPDRQLQPSVAPGPVWHERQPSSAAAHLPADERDRRAERAAHLIRLANGLHLGDTAVDPPEDDFPHLLARDWGQLAHGWFAEWRFTEAPTSGDIARWLAAEWGDAPDAVVTWLLRLSDAMARRGGPLWTLVTDPDATLHFEYPLVGVGRGQDQSLLLSGRIDLLVQRKRTLTIIDFKAGSRSPTGWDDLIAEAHLKSYGPQLEAYRDTLANMGHAIDLVALWFVRTGTSVRW